MTAHSRNTLGLKTAALAKRERTIIRAKETITRLLKEGVDINFQVVAKAAKISQAWLYRHPEIREKIDKLRSQPKSIIKQRPSDLDILLASQGSIITTLKHKIKELQEENANLKKQLEIVYGRLHQLNP